MIVESGAAVVSLAIRRTAIAGSRRSDTQHDDVHQQAVTDRGQQRQLHRDDAERGESSRQPAGDQEADDREDHSMLELITLSL